MIDFSAEVFFTTARSGGKGGQNVNKVETMAEAIWHIASSVFFTDTQKETIQTALAGRINQEGLLKVRSQESRSQLANKKTALLRLMSLVNQSLITRKKRIKTKPTKGMMERRLETKRYQADKKLRRRKDW